MSNGGMDIYVMKLDSLGQMIFSTYIGANGTDDAYGVCTDNANYIYISGHTNSGAFYTSPGAFQSGKSLGNDGYCLSLSPAGNMLWSTFLGGTGQDFMARMHINSNKELVLLVNSQSTDFPMLGSASTTVSTGGQDAVIVKLLTNGTPFWSGYLGGSLTDSGNDLISIDKTKTVVVGKTVSSDFPVYGNIHQNSFAGTDDGFLCVISVGTSSLASVNEINLSKCPDPFYVYESSEIRFREECRKKITYRITDILGKVLEEKEIPNGNISVNNLAQGVYFIHFYDLSDGFRMRFKFYKD
jgi:hypothetical protein